MTRIKEIINSDADLIVVERSVFTDKNVFMECNFKRGSISEIEYNIYNQWFDVFSKQFQLQGKYYIYLKTSKETCDQRIRNRDRTGENGIPLEGLQKPVGALRAMM